MHRLRLPAVLVAVVALAGLSAAACAGVASPKGWAGPVVTDGMLLAAHRDELFAFDAETLQPQWQFPDSGDIDDGDVEALYGTPAVADGRVFVPTYDGKLFALDLESGAPLWPQPFEADGPLIGGVAVDGGTVYFGSSDAKVYAVDVETGEMRWPAFKTDREIWSTPVVANGNLYVTSLDSRLYVLDAATGEELWSFKTSAGVAAAPVLDEAGGRVLVGGFDARLRSVDLQTQEQVWSVRADNWFWSRPLLNAGVVFAASLDKKVYAVSAATSEEEWGEPFRAGAEIQAGPVVAGETLFVADRDGMLYALDPASGAEAQPPVDVDGDVLADLAVMEYQGAEVVVVVTTGGDVVLIDAETLQEVRRIEL